MNASRPQPVILPLRSRFAVPLLAGRYYRHAVQPFPLRLVLLRVPAPSATPSMPAAPAAAGMPDTRLTLALAPRIAVSIPAPATLQGTSPGVAGPAGRPGLSRFERRIEHLFQRTSRVERSKLTITVRERVRRAGGNGTAPVSPVVQTAPRMVTASQAPPPNRAPTTTASTSTAPAVSSATTWRPPDPNVLADGVLREIDRRITAERERMGRL